jgi:hypothetical protein
MTWGRQFAGHCRSPRESQRAAGKRDARAPWNALAPFYNRGSAKNERSTSTAAPGTLCHAGRAFCLRQDQARVLPSCRVRAGPPLHSSMATRRIEWPSTKFQRASTISSIHPVARVLANPLATADRGGSSRCQHGAPLARAAGATEDVASESPNRRD